MGNCFCAKLLVLNSVGYSSVGRGAKTIKLLLDHNLSYEDNTYDKKLLCLT